MWVNKYGTPSSLTWRHPSLYPLLCISAPTYKFIYLPWEMYVCFVATCAFVYELCKCGYCVFSTFLKSLGERGCRTALGRHAVFWVVYALKEMFQGEQVHVHVPVSSSRELGEL